MSKVAIAILNYNGERYLKQFLPTLIAHSNEHPIYIGDNASSDGSVKLLRDEFPEITCIDLGENHGYSKGYNLLIKHIEAEYVALVNSDIEVTNNWLQPLIDLLDADNEIAAVQPKIRSYHNKEVFEYAGAAGGYVDKYGYPFCRGRLFDTLEKDEGQYDDSAFIKWASGACFLVRKSDFEKVGGFDNDFFAHMEEIDLCWRFYNEGLKVHFVPQSCVYHVGGGTLDYTSPLKTYLNYRNGLYLLIKNLPDKELQQKLLVRILLDWVSIFYQLAKGNWKLGKSIIKAHIEVFKNRKKFVSKRNENQSKKGFTENYSIIWNYFAKGNKIFSFLPDVNSTKQN